ncbi:helix-turn-helix domain-containing protein [Paenibacillus yanchengensis]|uniref:Helix-turn-helix domain-containing protein n=1 Tax=Paenibacillus yanchengensis TaxID=2035833 RepID=A0ABW4YMI0_9BACL
MSELGALLREAREEKKMTLEDIQDLTKIRTRYLEAIESGDYSVLPGSFYVKAFIKNYAEAVGLDADEVLRLYQHDVPSSTLEQDNTEPIEIRPPRKLKKMKSDRVGKIGFNIVMWCFFILIIVLVWYYAFTKENAKPDQLNQENITDNSSPLPTSNTSTAISPSPTIEPTPKPTPTVTITLDEAKSTNRESRFKISSAKDTHKITVAVSGGNTWLEMRKDSRNGEKLFYSTANDGEKLEFDIAEVTYLDVRWPKYTEIKIDGVLVDDGDGNSSKRLVLELEKEEETE